MKEVWKDVPGYEGSYQASTDGRVRSLDRHVNHYSGGKSLIKGKVLTPRPRKNGYESICLRNEAGAKDMLVHRIIAITFLERANNKPMINHLDGVKTNNAVTNLEW